jgi:hypothetical protein
MPGRPVIWAPVWRQAAGVSGQGDVRVTALPGRQSAMKVLATGDVRIVRESQADGTRRRGMRRRFWDSPAPFCCWQLASQQ